MQKHRKTASYICSRKYSLLFFYVSACGSGNGKIVIGEVVFCQLPFQEPSLPHSRIKKEAGFKAIFALQISRFEPGSFFITSQNPKSKVVH